MLIWRDTVTDSTKGTLHLDSEQQSFVTIGICVRNGEKTLSDAVNSILDQDYPPKQLQIIFVDDGSEDNTPLVIAEFARILGDRVKSFRSSWKGLGYARNLIVQMAQGEFILFVDADQILTDSYLRKQIDVMRKNFSIGITAGVFRTVPDNLILNLELAPHIVNQKTFGKPKKLAWKKDTLIGTGGTTFRTIAVREVNGFDEGIKGAGEDTDLVLRIKKAGWLIEPNAGELYELHGGLSKPYDLWRKYFWYGYGCQKTYSRNREVFSLLRMSPLAGLVTGILYSFPAYRVLYQKQMFLLPLHYGFKHVAWVFGFIKGQLKSD